MSVRHHKDILTEAVRWSRTSAKTVELENHRLSRQHYSANCAFDQKEIVSCLEFVLRAWH